MQGATLYILNLDSHPEYGKTLYIETSVTFCVNYFMLFK